MSFKNEPYKEIKAISIGVVSELTALSYRKIRYYEEQKLISPQKSKANTRKYSFSDIEKLIEISSKIKEGYLTKEIRKEMEQAERKREAAYGLVDGLQ